MFVNAQELQLTATPRWGVAAEVGQRVTVTSPVRVADAGGSTDTWWGAPGAVCHVAVNPGITVQASKLDEPIVRLVAPDIGLHDSWSQPPGRDRLLESAIGTARGVELVIRSSVPPGSAMGTSASVVVAVLAALDALTGQRSDPAALATRAHEVETVLAGRESGVQDQWAAAMGGVGLLTVGPYPDVQHRHVHAKVDLSGKLLTVVVGGHDSSAVHTGVVQRLRGRRPAVLTDLANQAFSAAAALEDGDLASYGAALTEATRLQAVFDPALVGQAHRAVIDAAKALEGVLGWKVNGSGGAGGSVTFVCEDDVVRTQLRRLLAGHDLAWRCVDLEPAAGVAVHWD